MIDLAIDLAEKQLREGTASSQVISHYLKLASTRNELEKEHLKKKNELMDAQIDSLKSSKNIEELFKSAMTAYRSYTSGDEHESEDI